MSIRDLKALGAKAVDTLRRLELRSGTMARLSSPSTPGMAEHEENATEMLPRIQELEQKLEMAEQAVFTKDQELQEVREELERTQAIAAEDLLEARSLAEEAKGTLERVRADATRLGAHARELEEQLEQVKTEARKKLEDQEDKLELARLRQVEALRQQFDKEREKHYEELERNAALVDGLRKKLESREAAVRESISESERVRDSSNIRETRRVTFSEPTTTPKTSGVLSGSGDPVVTAEETEAPPRSDSSTMSSTNGESNVDSGVPQSPVAAPISSSNNSFMQSLAQLVKTQTDMVAAQTRAMSAQTLPPMPHFSGEGDQTEDTFERWLEQFEERAKLVSWSEDHKKYHLKMSLDKTAFQAYRLLPDSVKVSYSDTVGALKKRFKPVDIEELRGIEFHQMTQDKQSIEQLGLDLQRMAKRAFPSLTGKDLDRLLKGRFFQALLPKWQRKLGAPKTEESFDELYSRARITERREQQYSEAAGEKCHASPKTSKEPERQVSVPQRREPTNTEAANPSDGNGRMKGIQCNFCRRFGHIARYCPDRQKRNVEAPGRSGYSTVPSTSVLRTVTDLELQRELATRRLVQEQNT